MVQHEGMARLRDITFDPPLTGSVVVGFDGSDAAMRAVQVAADEALLRGVPLSVVRAWMFSDSAAEAGAPLGTVPSLVEVEVAVRAGVEAAVAAVTREREGLQAAGHVVHAKAVQVLVAASQAALLLVVSRRGEGGFVDLLLGSTADQVIRHARSSVLVVRP